VNHDELLAEIDSYSYTYKPKSALRAVVELHKPDVIGNCDVCEEWTNEGPYQFSYPCPTIQAIEKELK